jgi:hypothetical protein
MYFAANTGNGFNIWRQRFPDGMREQMTSGATEEQGISFVSDGKSFVTSVGESQSTLWVHDTKGERQITFEGYRFFPSPRTPGGCTMVAPCANRRFVAASYGRRTRKWQTAAPAARFLMEHYNVRATASR